MKALPLRQNSFALLRDGPARSTLCRKGGGLRSGAVDQNAFSIAESGGQIGGQKRFIWKWPALRFDVPRHHQGRCSAPASLAMVVKRGKSAAQGCQHQGPLVDGFGCLREATNKRKPLGQRICCMRRCARCSAKTREAQ